MSLLVLIGFKYEPYLCNGCHGLMQKAVSFNDVAIVYVKGNAHRIYFGYMSKDDAINTMNNFNLIDKMGVLYLFLLRIKWVRKLIIKETDVILNRAKGYYENDKERLRKQARDKYRNLSEEKKNEKRKYGKKQIS